MALALIKSALRRFLLAPIKNIRRYGMRGYKNIFISRAKRIFIAYAYKIGSAYKNILFLLAQAHFALRLFFFYFN